MLSFSWLWFIIVKGHTAKPVKRKGSWGGKVWRKQGTSFPESSPSEVTQDLFISPSKELWQHVWNVIYQGSSVEIQIPRFVLGASHIGSLCLACTKTPDFQKESQVFSISFIVFTDSLGAVIHFNSGISGNDPKVILPRCPPVANLVGKSF